MVTSTPSATPSESLSAGPSVTASGSLSLYSEVATEINGSCQLLNGLPTVQLSTKANDFYDSVTITAVATEDRTAATAVAINLDNDQEGNDWVLRYPGKGASVKVTVKGTTITFSGKLYEESPDPGDTLPFTVTAECAQGVW